MAPIANGSKGVASTRRLSLRRRKPRKRTDHAGAEGPILRAIKRQLAGQHPRPTVATVATELSISARTLQRRFQRNGVSFRIVLDQCRRQQALHELLDRRRAIGEISTKLGYSDPAHFSRAFRRWTGRSPTDYRRGAAEHDGSAVDGSRPTNRRL